MLLRYALAFVVVVLLAGGIAVTTYRLTPVNYQGTCTFEMALPVTADVTSNTDVIAFQAQRAASEVAQAGRGDIYSGPASAASVDPASLAANTTVGQVPSSPDFVVVVTDANGPRSADLANRMCDVYVQRLTAQVQEERDAEVTQLQAKITALQQSVDQIGAIPAASRQPSDGSFLAAQQQALKTDQTLLATVLALPPDNIAVATRAPGGVRNDTRSVTRNLLVAGVAALLASFLIILVGEVARDTRLRT